MLLPHLEKKIRSNGSNETNRRFVLRLIKKKKTCGPAFICFFYKRFTRIFVAIALRMCAMYTKAET